MVAAGLTPKAVYDGADTDLEVHLCNLCEFAFAMQEAIKRFNKHSFNNFQLRMGMWLLFVRYPLSDGAAFPYLGVICKLSTFRGHSISIFGSSGKLNGNF